MKKFSPRTAGIGDKIYDLVLSYDEDDNISSYVILDYIILGISNTSETGVYIIKTDAGNLNYYDIQINQSRYFSTLEDARKMLSRKINENIKKIKREASDKIEFLNGLKYESMNNI